MPETTMEKLISLWIPLAVIAMSGVSGFVWLQADVRAGEVEGRAQKVMIVENKLENENLKRTQTELRIYSAEYKIELKAIKRLLEQIRVQTK